MPKYLILLNPGHNRIYFETSLNIALSEIAAIANEMNISNLEQSNLDLPASIVFETDRELNNAELKMIKTSSIYYALFEIMTENLLKPISTPDFHVFPESMVQILKYLGKTNEQFTRLMVNLAISACKTDSEQITLLDPMCGKGTTLYEGLIRGYNVKGIEINEAWTLEIQNYLTRFLKEGRYKHRIQKIKQTDDLGKRIANLFMLDTAANKDDFNSGIFQNVQVFYSDTRFSNQIIKKNSCDIIVSDLPYGVQHGSKTDYKSKMSRNPIELLKEAIPAWYPSLKKGGSIVLSFNEFTLKYTELSALLNENNFQILDETPYNNYLHRVDQSINRNLIIAIKD